MRTFIGIDDTVEARLWVTLPGGLGVYVTQSGKVLKEVPVWEGNGNKGLEGYPCVTVGPYNKAVHQLVAECFVPNDDPLNKTQVDHLDSNKKNFHFTNLEWTTPKENNERAHARRENPRGLRVRCVETGVIYRSCGEASRYYRGDESMAEGIRRSVRGAQSKCGGLHWEEVLD